MRKKKNLILKILPVAAGGFLGYLYYYFIGCNTGGCPITGNPYVSTLYGAFIGLIISLPSKVKIREENGTGN